MRPTLSTHATVFFFFDRIFRLGAVERSALKLERYSTYALSFGLIRKAAYFINLRGDITMWVMYGAYYEALRSTGYYLTPKYRILNDAAFFNFM